MAEEWCTSAPQAVGQKVEEVEVAVARPSCLPTKAAVTPCATGDADRTNPAGGALPTGPAITKPTGFGPADLESTSGVANEAVQIETETAIRQEA